MYPSKLITQVKLKKKESNKKLIFNTTHFFPFKSTYYIPLRWKTKTFLMYETISMVSLLRRLLNILIYLYTITILLYGCVRGLFIRVCVYE